MRIARALRRTLAHGSSTRFFWNLFWLSELGVPTLSVDEELLSPSSDPGARSALPA